MEPEKVDLSTVDRVTDAEHVFDRFEALVITAVDEDAREWVTRTGTVEYGAWPSSRAFGLEESTLDR